MIIKIIPLKSGKSVGRVVNYIATDKGRIKDHIKHGIFHNIRSLYSESIAKEFKENYEVYAKKRSNGNKALHIILSASPVDRGKLSTEIMRKLTEDYINRAYPNVLAFAEIHESEKHLHAHLIVSSNEVASSKSTRLSKKDLREIHQYMIENIRSYDKTLSKEIDMSKWGARLGSEKEYYQRKRHPDKVLNNDLLQEKVKNIFRLSQSSETFFKELQKQGFTTYQYRDRVNGILTEDNKKIRFSRLGIKSDLIKELDKQNTRLRELEDIRSLHKNEKELERGLQGDARGNPLPR